MLGSGIAMPSGESETPADLHSRARRVRGFAREMVSNEDVTLLTALADELDARAEMMASKTGSPLKGIRPY